MDGIGQNMGCVGGHATCVDGWLASVGEGEAEPQHKRPLCE